MYTHGRTFSTNFHKITCFFQLFTATLWTTSAILLRKSRDVTQRVRFQTWPEVTWYPDRPTGSACVWRFFIRFFCKQVLSSLNRLSVYLFHDESFHFYILLMVILMVVMVSWFYCAWTWITTIHRGRPGLYSSAFEEFVYTHFLLVGGKRPELNSCEDSSRLFALSSMGRSRWIICHTLYTILDLFYDSLQNFLHCPPLFLLSDLT